MKRIKILGGGIAGLTAAINLKKAGVDAEIHERKDFCGKRTNDFQFLENWTFDDDALDILRSMHIQADDYIKPWYTQEIISPFGKKYVGTSKEPLMYLIKRGNQQGSLDRSLTKQAVRRQIPIKYNSKLNFKDADIIATGINKPNFIATGIKFPFEHPDRSIVILDDNLSFKMYSYFIVNDSLGEIVSANPTERKDHVVRLNQTVKRFEQILGIKIQSISERFSAPVSFHYLNQATINRQYIAGEAAGFQDCLACFGMMYAFKSGYFAAKSISEGCDYDRLWQDDFLKPMEISVRNRQIFEKLTNRGYEMFIDVLNSKYGFNRKLPDGGDLRNVLKKIYNHSLLQLLLPSLSS